MSERRRQVRYGNLVRAAAAVQTISPRVRMAARLYATAACPTKSAAAKAAGIGKEWFTTLTNHNEEVKRLTGDIDSAIQDESIATSQILQELGRKAIGKINRLMDTAAKEDVQLRAAVDLADRSPETSKIQRHQIESMQISSNDAKELAKALVEAARVNQKYAEEVQGDYIKVNSDAPAAALPAPPARPDLEPVEEGEAELGQVHEAPERT